MSELAIPFFALFRGATLAKLGGSSSCNVSFVVGEGTMATGEGCLAWRGDGRWVRADSLSDRNVPTDVAFAKSGTEESEASTP